MRKSKTLARIRKNETVRMCCLGHFMPFFVKHAAHFGFDCIWLDMEHRNFSDREIQTQLAHSHLHDIDIMVRPATTEKTRLYRYLEDGAAGLMIPHINTAEKTKMLVDAVKFPPVGDRGLDGAGLDGVFVGPSDLGLRLKLDASNMSLETAYEKVAASCKKNGKAWGCPTGTPEILKQRQKQGGQLLNHGGEFGAVMNMLKTCVAAFD